MIDLVSLINKLYNQELLQELGSANIFFPGPIKMMFFNPEKVRELQHLGCTVGHERDLGEGWCNCQIPGKSTWAIEGTSCQCLRKSAKQVFSIIRCYENEQGPWGQAILPGPIFVLEKLAIKKHSFLGGMALESVFSGEVSHLRAEPQGVVSFVWMSMALDYSNSSEILWEFCPCLVS